MAVGAAAYMLFAIWQGVLFLRSGDLIAALLGIAVLALPLLGLWMIYRELRFGLAVQKLAERLDRDGALPLDNLPRLPSGRIERDAADAEFEQASLVVAQEPRSAAAWFRLSLAYEAARDRKRARKAMRYAVALDAGDLGPPPVID
jgi:hypothetical protein